MAGTIIDNSNAATEQQLQDQTSAAAGEQIEQNAPPVHTLTDEQCENEKELLGRLIHDAFDAGKNTVSAMREWAKEQGYSSTFENGVLRIDHTIAEHNFVAELDEDMFYDETPLQEGKPVEEDVE